MTEVNDQYPVYHDYNGGWMCAKCGEQHVSALPEGYPDMYKPKIHNEAPETDYPIHCIVCDDFLGNPLNAQGMEIMRQRLHDGVGDTHRLEMYAEFYKLPLRQVHCVSVYLVDRSLYSHAEGGCYFDHGTPVMNPTLPLPRFVIDHESAVRVCREMQEILDNTVNKDRRPLSSVLSEGVYRACIDVNSFPKPWPDRTPTYE